MIDWNLFKQHEKSNRELSDEAINALVELAQIYVEGHVEYDTPHIITLHRESQRLSQETLDK